MLSTIHGFVAWCYGRKAKSVLGKCRSNYEHETRNNLLETRAVLSAIYCTITSDNNNDNNIGEPNCLTDEVIANKELACQICTIAKDINRVLFNS